MPPQQPEDGDIVVRCDHWNGREWYVLSRGRGDALQLVRDFRLESASA